ncbi:MAG TPA: DCC1-like thiol-disulfide oxidoreductase family protein [Yinghuangia sp.]|uniref:thiol-disulfide oxidoreductase DCC family protein n=1 Tax=Yinghuangia sp. YIM S10712 TaxID=3436930 RepID=UPI002C315663|nr:DCC1-like thiol-disulfide oxidoreductase family protein [Yinghuangia sp.]
MYRGEASPVAPTVPPVRRITVLYDADCPLCTAVSGRLARRPKLVAIDLIPAGSARARNRYPDLDHERTLREITVVGDSGQVYEGAYAWVVCLWALRGYRRTAERLSTPAGLAVAKAAVVAAARVRASTRDDSGFDDPGGFDGCANGCLVPG